MGIETTGRSTLDEYRSANEAGLRALAKLLTERIDGLRRVHPEIPVSTSQWTARRAAYLDFFAAAQSQVLSAADCLALLAEVNDGRNPRRCD
jgi:hypothetical protein